MEEHSLSTREAALAMMRRGIPNRLVAEELDVPRGTVGWWRHQDRKARGERYEYPHDCPLHGERALDDAPYSYLLGLYLGDGHIVRKPRQNRLCVSCTLSWPGLTDRAEQAMRQVMPAARTSRRRRDGCVEVMSYSAHWPCLFPQHGPGRKHERRIALEAWQQGIVTHTRGNSSVASFTRTDAG